MGKLNFIGIHFNHRLKKLINDFNNNNILYGNIRNDIKYQLLYFFDANLKKKYKK